MKEFGYLLGIFVRLLLPALVLYYTRKKRIKPMLVFGMLSMLAVIILY